MISYQSLFLIKGLTSWNNMRDWFQSMTSHVQSMYQSIFQWVLSKSTTWYLYPNTLFPLIHSYYHGLNTAQWKYRSDTHVLTYLQTQTEARMKRETGTKMKFYRVEWLSVQTASKEKTKDMDDFLSRLRIKIPEGVHLPPMVLLQAWSIHDKCWWSADETLQLKWIDSLADEHSAVYSNVPHVPLVPIKSHTL